MTEKGPYDRESEPKLNDLFARLVGRVEASVAAGEPVEFSRDEAVLIREELVEAGVNIELGETERESLAASHLRLRVGDLGKVEIYDRKQPEGERWVAYKDNIDREGIMDDAGEVVDASLGMQAALGHDGLVELVAWCNKEADRLGYTKVIGGHKGTKGRGLQQAAADIVRIATLDPQAADFQEKLDTAEGSLNRGLWRGFIAADREGEVNTDAFKAKGIERPTSRTAGFPPEALPELIRFVAGEISE